MTFAIKVVRKSVAAIRRNKSIRTECISGEIPNSVWEAMIPYFVRLLDITMNNFTLSVDWNIAIIFPVHKG